MLNPKKIENFWGGDFIESSPDLTAVKYGIKKVARMECNSVEDFKKIKKKFKENSIKVVCSDEKLFDKFNIYISKSEKLATKAKKIDPSFKIINHKKEFTEITDDIYQFSKLMNYPRCCIDEHIKNTLNNIKVPAAKVFLKLPKKINFLLNNILNGISNHYLSFHFPCSFTCSKTLDYQKKIFNKIKQVSPEFAKEIKEYLKRPYLIFLDPSLSNIYVSWDNRKCFMFDGLIKSNDLSYSNTIYLQTHYPDYRNSKLGKEFNLLIDKIKQGNKIILGKSGFKVYKSRTLLYKFENTKGSQVVLFNFI